MKTPLLILHGAIGSNRQMGILKERLQEYYDVHAPNFPGHGGEELPGDFSISFFADHIKAYIDLHRLQNPIVFGYSMGGYVACYLGLRYPSLASKIITLATKFNWDPDIAAKEISMLDANVIEQKIPKFAGVLKERHSPQDWKTVLTKTASLLASLGADPLLKDAFYKEINTPCLLMIGDRDKMVSIEETMGVYRMLPNAQFSVLPATQHPVEQAPAELLVYLIRSFASQ